MASVTLFEVSISIFCFLFLYCFLFKKPLDRFVINWPLLGMIPGFVLVHHRIYDFTVELLEKSDLTFLFKGLWFMGMDMLITADPRNIHYLLSSNFSNYVKGADFKELFDTFGDSLLTADSEVWKNLRKVTQNLINHQGFLKLSMCTTRSKLKDGLVPLFNHFSKEGKTVDLQDVFGRFTFDTTLVTITGCDDPKSLSIEMSKVELAQALDVIGEGIMYRHAKPTMLWKLQRWMKVGSERKMIEADATFDRFFLKYIATRREEIRRSKGIIHGHFDGENEDMLTSHIKLDTTKYQVLNPIDDKFLRDTIVGFFLAGRDTVASVLTWFFWLLSENPEVLSKIRQEMSAILPVSSSEQERSSYDLIEYLNKLVYLHATLCETMRLYPPIPIERVSPVESDVLPSGHKVKANARILIFIYTLGRMRAVWGDNALEFKPERWISDTGTLRHEPSFKFLAFNAGPRTCLGKQIAMIQMKTVVVEILQNYDIKVAKGQKIEPRPHLALNMRQGLRVTISKRCSS